MTAKTNRAIKIIKKQCPNCGHNRAWRKPSIISCSRCGHEVKD